MQSKKRSRRSICLSGGDAEKPRTVGAYRSGEDVDVVVKSAEDASYKAHKLVLKAGSRYFERALSREWAEAPEPHMLPTVHAPELEACLEWIYTGTCDSVDDEALRGLVTAAMFLQIDTLVNVALQEMRDRLDASTSLPTWSLAEFYDADEQLGHKFKELATAAATTACMHYSSLARSEEWKKAPVNHVRALLGDARLCVESEEEVHRAAQAWLSAQEPSVDAKTAAEFLALAGSIRRCGVERLFALGGAGTVDGVDCEAMEAVEYYNPLTNVWEEVKDMMHYRECFGAAVLRGSLYVAGHTATAEFSNCRLGLANASNGIDELRSIDELWIAFMTVNSTPTVSVEIDRG